MDEASEHPGSRTLGEDEEDGEWGFVVSSRLRDDEEEEWPDWGLTAADSDTLPELLSLLELDLAGGDLRSADERGRAALDQARRRLPGRRRRFEPHDPAGSHYLRALELLGDVRRRQELWPEWCRLARLRAEARPDAEALCVYGSSLQKLGRTEEALAQYARAPYRHPWRFYLSAAAACQLGRREDCIDFVLGGLVRDRQVWRDRQRARAGRPAYRSTGFWERFGLVWSKEALELLAAVAEQPAVCGLVAFSANEGVVPRKLFFAHGRKILSRRVQAVMEGKRFCIMTNEPVDANTPLKKIGPGLCQAGPELA